jgi:SAM-dependent methyltransferase
LISAAYSAGVVFQSDGTLTALLNTRRTVAEAFLEGAGIEIGALHQPLQVPRRARVRYVDRMPSADLRQHYKELAGERLVEPDIINDGELLVTIPDASQDFVVANHFLEHCENPIMAMQNFFRVLKPGAVLYLAVPDKRFTFDVNRPSTTIDHLLRDFTEGPAWSKTQHFEEWSRLVNHQTDPADIADEARRLMEMRYSIHFHVWNAADLLELVAGLQRFASFEPELFLRNGIETILILRKPSV